MQQFKCVSFLLMVAILSATLGSLVTIAHRELLMVTNGERQQETKLTVTEQELTVEEIKDEETRNNVLAGQKMTFGDVVMQKMETKDARSKPSPGDITSNLPNSYAPSSIKDSSISRRKAGPSMYNIKLEVDTSELVLNIPNHQQMTTLTSKKNPSSDSKAELKESIVRSTLYKINDDWKEIMLEASDEVLRLLNRDYYASPRRALVHN